MSIRILRYAPPTISPCINNLLAHYSPLKLTEQNLHTPLLSESTNLSLPMTTRRTFLYQTAIATTALATNPLPLFSVNRKVRARRRLELTFEPYELQLRHVFTVASYSRSSTPDIQVRIDYDGFTGYGEASMPPYLSAELGTTESVMDFLGRAATLLREFDDPFRMDEILTAIDRMDQGNAAGKAAIDIALHDLVGRIMEQPWYRIWGLSP